MNGKVKNRVTTLRQVTLAESSFVSPSETELIGKATCGDMDAYQQLYQSHCGRVYALCLRLTGGDRAMAEDATQEVFIQLWKKLKNFHGQSAFSTWLHSVASNVTISYIRKQRGWWQRMLNIEDSEAMHAPAEESVDNVSLDTYVMRLPERARIVFVLYAIEGYRHEEVARMLNIAVGSSKAQFHRAKTLLKEWMGYE